MHAYTHMHTHTHTITCKYTVCTALVNPAVASIHPSPYTFIHKHAHTYNHIQIYSVYIPSQPSRSVYSPESSLRRNRPQSAPVTTTVFLAGDVFEQAERPGTSSRVNYARAKYLLEK